MGLFSGIVTCFHALLSVKSRAHYGFQDGDVVFVAIGAMTTNKGVTEAVQSFVSLYQKYPSAFVKSSSAEKPVMFVIKILHI